MTTQLARQIKRALVVDTNPTAFAKHLGEDKGEAFTTLQVQLEPGSRTWDLLSQFTPRALPRGSNVGPSFLLHTFYTFSRAG